MTMQIYKKNPSKQIERLNQNQIKTELLTYIKAKHKYIIN